MSGFTAGYRSRLITHEELIARFRPGNVITLGTWMGQPHGVTRSAGAARPGDRSPVCFGLASLGPTVST